MNIYFDLSINFYIYLQKNKTMNHSIIDVKRYFRELGYGDYKEIRDRLAEKGIEVSKSAITQVIRQVYYNQDILDTAREVLRDKVENLALEGQALK